MEIAYQYRSGTGLIAFSGTLAYMLHVYGRKDEEVSENNSICELP